MYKVTKILEISPYFIICEINDILVKKIDILPLLENHKNFPQTYTPNQISTIKLAC